MVRLPLLIGARPLFLVNKRGPVIPLGRGDWYISSNHKDSQILIECVISGVPVSRPHINGSLTAVRVGEGERATVQVVLDKVGTETSLDVFAERR